jgi:hypothetical protein
MKVDYSLVSPQSFIKFWRGLSNQNTHLWEPVTATMCRIILLLQNIFGNNELPFFVAGLKSHAGADEKLVIYFRWPIKQHRICVLP